MLKLPTDVKLAIIERLAAFEGPTRVAEQINEQFGLSLLPQHIERYDPSKLNGRNLSPELKQLFEEIRKRFVEEVTSIACAHQSYRLRKIQRVIERAERENDSTLLLTALRQAACEVGGYFTNRRELSGPKGGAIPISVRDALERVYGDGNGSQDLPIAEPELALPSVLLSEDEETAYQPELMLSEA